MGDSKKENSTQLKNENIHPGSCLHPRTWMCSHCTVPTFRLRGKSNSLKGRPIWASTQPACHLYVHAGVVFSLAVLPSNRRNPERGLFLLRMARDSNNLGTLQTR